MPFGTLATFDTLASNTTQTIAEFGEDNAFVAIEALFVAHNAIMREMIATLCEITTDRQRRYGGADNMLMEQVDEFGRADAQKISAGATVGFPLYLHQISLQWTRKYLQNATGAEFAAQVRAMLDAHRKRITRDIKLALFTPTNNTAYTDDLVDKVNLSIRRLVNADSQPIPIGPNGEVVDASTHTHYLARVSTLAASDISGLLETVREHWGTGSQMLLINRAQEAAIRGFTSNFTPYLDARLVPATTTVNARNAALAQTNLYNRAIGLFDGAEVWIKPWIPANYMFTYIQGIERPLVFRERRPGASNLIIAAEDEAYPLRAETGEAEYGIGAWTRTNGAVLYVGGTSYVAPTIVE